MKAVLVDGLSWHTSRPVCGAVISSTSIVHQPVYDPGPALSAQVEGWLSRTMKRVTEVLRRSPVWVNPGHRASTAVLLMRGHDERGLAVMDGPRVVGLLDSSQLLGVDAETPVERIMTRSVMTLLPSATVRDAAEVLSRPDVEYVVVVGEGGELVGTLSRGDLLPELRRSVDPLTELPWSDTLREWAIERLQNGHEITVIFLDVNRFGQFNRQFGHVVGDAVLRQVAAGVRAETQSATDIACRYGGDEFCIVTLRLREEAEAMAERVIRNLAGLQIPEARGQGIGITAGIRGGRRTREREQVHFAATLNNLINLASQDCLKKKAERYANSSERMDVLPDVEARPEKISYPEPPVATQERLPTVERTGLREKREASAFGRLELSRLNVGDSEEVTEVLVELRHPLRVGTGGLADQSSGRRHLENVVEARKAVYVGTISRQSASGRVSEQVAEATARALCAALPEGYSVLVDQVITSAAADGSPFVTVLGKFYSPEGERAVAGTVLIAGDQNRAAAAAVLAAMNRSVERAVNDAATLGDAPA